MISDRNRRKSVSHRSGLVRVGRSPPNAKTSAAIHGLVGGRFFLLAHKRSGKGLATSNIDRFLFFMDESRKADRNVSGAMVQSRLSVDERTALRQSFRKAAKELHQQAMLIAYPQSGEVSLR